MSKGIPILFVVMCLATGTALWASTRGVGVKQPVKKPVSIREGSQSGIRYHRRRSHYGRRHFVGGGLFGGK